MTDNEWDRNVQFNKFIESLQTRVQIIAVMADGAPLAVETPTIFPEESR